MEFRYRYDTETGLYYLNSRYYNPEWGRFINADAVAGSLGELLSHNVFMYCKNNPVNMSDDSGYRPNYICNDGGEMGYHPTDNTEPIGHVEIPSSPSIISRAADIATVVVGELTKFEKYTVAKTGTLGGGPLELKVLLKAAQGLVKPFASAAKRVSYGITAALGVWDVTHIWTVQSGLTKGQRVGRTFLKIAAIGVGILAGGL